MLRSVGRIVISVGAVLALAASPSAYGNQDSVVPEVSASTSAATVAQPAVAVPKELKKMCDTIAWYVSAGEAKPCSSKLINAVEKCKPAAKRTRGPFGVGENLGEYYFAYCTELYGGSGMWYGHSWLSEYKDTWLYPKSISRTEESSMPGVPVQPTDAALRTFTRRLVEAQLTRFDEYAFSDAISLGDSRKYGAAITMLTDVKVDWYTGWQTNAIALYLPCGASWWEQGIWTDCTIYYSEDPRNLVPGSKTYVAAMGTAWHEVTHAIEEDHNDFIAVNAGDKAYQERNIDFMEQLVNALSRLVNMENAARAGKSVKEVRAWWVKFTKAYTKAFTLKSTGKYGVNIAQLKAWTGFNVSPIAIYQKYATGRALPGRAGELLDEAVSGRKPARPPDPEDVNGTDWNVSDWLSGRWVGRPALGDLVFTQDGLRVTGNFTGAPGGVALKVTEHTGNNPSYTLTYLTGTFTYGGDLDYRSLECATGTMKLWFEHPGYRLWGAYFCNGVQIANIEWRRG